MFSFKIKEASLEAQILAIGCKNKSEKYELRDEIVSGKDDDEYVIITDRTNFYPESGGQQSDRGVIKSSNQTFRVDKVVTLKGYTFHCGKLENSDASIKVNDHVECVIDSQRRYQTSLNHTGVHVLNHAIRKHFGFENSIIQTNSIVSDDHLKFEFKFNEILHKPTIDDLVKIQAICNEVVQKSVPVYINDAVNLDVDDLNRFRYPVRKLKDVLYPVNIRLVSLGAAWDKFERLILYFFYLLKFYLSHRNQILNY